MAFGQGSSRWPDWLKFKNPAAPAVKREAEEDWGKEGWRQHERRESEAQEASTPYLRLP